MSQAIAAAQPVSEALSATGEADTLGRVTVNIGHRASGSSINLILAIPGARRAHLWRGRRGHERRDRHGIGAACRPSGGLNNWLCPVSFSHC